MKEFISTQYSKLNPNTKEVLNKSLASTIVKVTGTLIGLLISVFLGNTIGSKGLGIISLVNKFSNILIVFGLFGMRQVVVKEVAIANGDNNKNYIGNVVLNAAIFNFLLSGIIAVLLFFASGWISEQFFKDPAIALPLAIAVIVTPFQVLSRVFSSGLIGLRKIWQSNLVEQALSLVVVAVLLLFSWLLNYGITIKSTIIFYGIGRIVVALVVGIYWQSLNIYKFEKKNIINKLLSLSIPLFVISLSGIIIANADTIILGVFEAPEKIGIYAVAARIALITSFFLQITNAAVSPKIAYLYNSNKTKHLGAMIKQTTIVLSIIGILVLVILIVFGKTILGIWGAEFVDGYWILIILGFGQFINTSTGAVGVILIMTGNEKTQRNVTMFYTILSLFLTTFMAKFYGIFGVAISTSFIITALNLTKYYYVRTIISISLF